MLNIDDCILKQCEHCGGLFYVEENYENEIYCPYCQCEVD